LNPSLVRQFEIDSNLRENGCKYCAALLIVDRGERINPGNLGRVPNGTVTFIKCDGIHFAVTCFHVVESLRGRNKGSAVFRRYGFATVVNGNFLWEDAFRQPSLSLDDTPPDIAMQVIRPDFPRQIGKTFFELRPQGNEPTTPPDFALAVGFPTEDKEASEDQIGTRLSMPCVYAVADGPSVAGNRFYAELSAQQDTKNLSGLSGGPVFWSTKDAHGLLGFVREGSRTTPCEDGFGTSPRVHFVFVPMIYEVFSRWIDECHLRKAPVTTYPWVWPNIPPFKFDEFEGGNPTG
jgi:hypothetical protein